MDKYHAKTIYERPSALLPYGLGFLTSESCAYSERLLFDLSAPGAQLVCDWLGIRPEGLAEPWNSQVGAAPATASILLDREIIPTLIKFILMHREQRRFLLYLPAGASWLGLDADPREDPDMAVLMQAPGARVYVNPAARVPQEGGRVIHTFSGRTT